MRRLYYLDNTIGGININASFRPHVPFLNLTAQSYMYVKFNIQSIDGGLVIADHILKTTNHS
jgi:hypothetical protein